MIFVPCARKREKRIGNICKIAFFAQIGFLTYELIQPFIYPAKVSSKSSLPSTERSTFIEKVQHLFIWVAQSILALQRREESFRWLFFCDFASSCQSVDVVFFRLPAGHPHFRISLSTYCSSLITLSGFSAHSLMHRSQLCRNIFEHFYSRYDSRLRSNFLQQMRQFSFIPLHSLILQTVSHNLSHEFREVDSDQICELLLLQAQTIIRTSRGMVYHFSHRENGRYHNGQATQYQTIYFHSVSKKT